MRYQWISNQEIIKHINKHILNKDSIKSLEKEEKAWEKEFPFKYKHLKYDSDYQLKKHQLYNEYIDKSNEIIENENMQYIFKSGNNYSCNYKRKDNLTTCLQLKYIESKQQIKITSCFFRYSTVMDATILLYASKYFNENSVLTTEYTISGLLTYEKNLKKAIMETLKDHYNNEEKINVSLRLISNYLKLQYNNYKETKPIEEFEYFKYLILENRKPKINDKEKLLNMIATEELKIISLANAINLKKEIINTTILFLKLCKCSIEYIDNDIKFKQKAQEIIETFK